MHTCAHVYTYRYIYNVLHTQTWSSLGIRDTVWLKQKFRKGEFFDDQLKMDILDHYMPSTKYPISFTTDTRTY